MQGPTGEFRLRIPTTPGVNSPMMKAHQHASTIYYWGFHLRGMVKPSGNYKILYWNSCFLDINFRKQSEEAFWARHRHMPSIITWKPHLCSYWCYCQTLKWSTFPQDETPMPWSAISLRSWRSCSVAVNMRTIDNACVKLSASFRSASPCGAGSGA